ncbi:extracellular serine-threonine rich protein [Grosmannia clavigera kw1407]|uniref:Extracellular serine-threonine rich protein n=1 Tax=Grosmannia clavigera (strain kw1407 / UAMH 11150) TaxID=655863 RepID=F0XPS2_GROCL|nr:extracellular serine-threonine rich protein [Grosmannia clavigera kw1407]EFX00432.1 extracellular serine-threonine rich protein [Grosmannia clavigera kw1407]
MRYAAAAVFFAGAALAGTEAPESTIYSTDFVTITSCAPEVTNCPARTHSTVYPVTSSTVYSTNVYATTSAGTVGYSTESIPTISTSVTTVVPTVIYETVSVACPTGANTPVGTLGTVGVATPTGKSPVPSSSIVTAGAGNVAFSGVLAAAAGLVAVFLA